MRMRKSDLMLRYEEETGEIICRYGDIHYLGYVEWLEEQNSNLRADALKVMVKEFSLKNGDVKLELETGLTKIFANHVKEMMKAMGAENFLTSTFTFQGEDEPYYMTMGRCDGKTVSEKYLEVCTENQKLKDESDNLFHMTPAQEHAYKKEKV